LKLSTAILIVCRDRLGKTRPDKCSDFEKPMNELKNTDAQVKEKEKRNYTINTLTETYSYIGDSIDALMEGNQTVAYVKNKIKIAETREKSDQGERKSNAFAAEKERMLQMWESRIFCESVKISKGKAITVVGVTHSRRPSSQ
jgi:hypothetical protein